MLLRSHAWRRISKRVPWLLVCFAAFATQVLSAQQPPTGLVLYDNFKAKTIDPDKWTGFQFFSPDQREAVRELASLPEVREDRHSNHGRGLHIAERDFASPVDDGGASGDTFGLEFANPSAVREVSFTVMVSNAEAVACSSNPSLTVTDAEFRGHFFNSQASPQDQVGDVQATISIARTPSDVGNALTVSGFVEECTDQYCGSTTLLDSHVLGYVQPGETSRLRIKWDQPNHRFAFQLNHQPAVLSPYAVPDMMPAFFPFKILDVARVVPHCVATPRANSAIDVYFGNVYVNP